MSGTEWRWKIDEALDRIRTRLANIGRTTGAPLLALAYPPEAERAVLAEWRARAETLRPELDVIPVDVLDITQAVVGEIGVENVVDSLDEPMPGSDPRGELARLWLTAVARAVRDAFGQGRAGRTVVCVQRLAALHPAAGAQDLMRTLWDAHGAALAGPVVLLVPGTVTGGRTYEFLDVQSEWMYRGELL
jgi:hypothetical protein